MSYAVAAFGLFLVLALCAALVGYKVYDRFGKLTKAQVIDLVDSLLVHGEDFETLVFDDESSEAFVQFKKFVESTTDFGVELVFPIADRYASKKDDIMLICEEFDLLSTVVETSCGWPYIFVQLNEGKQLNKSAVSSFLRLSEIDFDNNVRVGAASSFKWSRKREVYGDEVLPIDRPNRHSC